MCSHTCTKEDWVPPTNVRNVGALQDTVKLIMQRTSQGCDTQDTFCLLSGHEDVYAAASQCSKPCELVRSLIRLMRWLCGMLSAVIGTGQASSGHPLGPPQDHQHYLPHLCHARYAHCNSELEIHVLYVTSATPLLGAVRGSTARFPQTVLW
jgi:hypothetical protein